MLVFSPSQFKIAKACSCAGYKHPLVAVVKADAVFAGRVVQTFDAWPDSSEVLSGGRPIVYTIEVLTTWKGTLADTTEITSAASGVSCGASIKTDRSYLFYAEFSRGILGTSSCNRTGRVERRDEDLKELSRLPSFCAGIDKATSQEIDSTATALLYEDLEGKSETSRLAAIEGLWRLGAIPPASIALPLQRVLSDGTAKERRRATRFLPRCEECPIALLAKNSFKDTSPAVRAEGTRVLLGSKELSPEEKLAVFQAAQKDPAAEVQLRAVQCIRFAEDRWESKVLPDLAPDIVALLNHPDGGMKAAACRTLGHAARYFPAALPELIAAARDSSRIRPDAFHALEEFEVSAPGLLDFLAEELQSDDREGRSRAAMTLGELGGEGRADHVFPLLVAATKDGDYHVRKHAARSLGKLLPDDRACDTLMSFLQSDDPALNERALRALADKSMPSAIAMEAIETAIPRSLRLRKMATSLATRRNIADPRMREVMRAALSDPDDQIREQAAQMMGSLGSFGRRAIPDLARLLDDPNESIRQAAERSLVELRSAHQWPDRIRH